MLNSYNIFLDSRVSKRCAFILMMLVFLCLGMINIMSEKNNTIGGVISSCIFIIPPILFIFSTLKETVRILTGKYVIVLDELMDKEYYVDHHRGTKKINHSGWLLYFKDYLKKYDEKIKIKNKEIGSRAQKGDKFYMVFVKGKKIPYIYESKKYLLSESEESKLIKIDELKDYINKKEFVLEKISQDGKIEINQKRIIDDFLNKDEKRTVLFFCLVNVFLLMFCMVTIKFLDNIIAFVISLIIFICVMIITIIKIKYLYGVVKKIKNNEYKIKKDEVISLNNSIQYRDSNQVVSFKFKGYKKLVYEDKRVFYNTEIGDEFYLIFVNGEKEPIKVYNSKNSFIKTTN